MLFTTRIRNTCLALGALALSGCTSLLGDFSYDPNATGNGGTGGGSGEQGEIVITPASGLVTSEQGSKATFTIVLRHPPTASVAIGLSSSNPAEGSVSPTVVSFSPENFSAPQMVQITGIDDENEDGPQPYTIQTTPATSEDVSYHGINPVDPQVTNIDNDTAGFTLMPPAGLVTTESGGEATFTIVLNHAPTADVIVPLSTDKPNEGTVSPATLTFTPLNWMAPQMVTVTGVDDPDKDGEQKFLVLTGNASSADNKYNGLEVPDEEVTNKDNDTAGVILTPSTGLLTFETGVMTSLSIALSSPPIGNVTIGLTSSDPSEGSVSPASVLFTPENWMAPQVVSVTGVDDKSVDGNQPYLVVTSIQASDDPDYAKLEPPDAEITNIDNDSPGITLDPPAGLLMTSEALASATFTVALNSKPSGVVLFDVKSNRPEEGVASPAQLTFDQENWDAPQVVNVIGVNDDVADGAQAYVVHVTPNATSADQQYAMLLEQDVTLTNTDNDSAGVTVDPTKGLVTTEGGGTATFTIRLNSKPKADVSIKLRSSSDAEGTVSPPSVTFTADNYSAGQMITVRGVDDKMQDGSPLYRIITENTVSQDPGYSGLEVPNVEVTNTDNDSAGITVEPRNQLLMTAENGQAATFTVKLNSQPANGTEVSFSLTSSDTTEGMVSPTTLKFTGANWNAPQMVTVKGQPDDAHDGPQNYRVTFGSVMSADPNYAGDRLKPLDVTLSNIDDDTPSIQIRNYLNLRTTERANGTATFQVALGSLPAGNVTIAVSSSRPEEGTVNPALLTFTNVNWAAAQNVTITGVDEKVQDGDQQYFVMLASAKSSDKDYEGKLAVPVANVTVTNVDDDSAGITVTAPAMIATGEPTVPATFTVQLNSQPTADVTIPLSSSRPTEGTVSPASLTFTSQNWNAPRTVTLTGVDDDSQDGDQEYFIKIGPSTSPDAKYNPKNVADLRVLNHDNDTAKILVGAISGPTTEKGGTATFTLALQTKPSADVSLVLASKDTGEGDVSQALVVFTPFNWASPQTITVTGANDKMQDGPQSYIIDVGAATSTDKNYSGLDPADVTVINNDDDTAKINVVRLSSETTESGGTATFSIWLDTQPSNNATVTLDFASNNPSEGVLSDSSVVFNGVDYASPKVITVTGVDDDSTADGNQPFNVVFTASKSADTNYAGKVPTPLAFTNLDNDSAGIVVSPKTGTTSEDLDAMSFTVVLSSKPKADVKIPVKSSNEAEGTVSTALLTFTTVNWKSMQTVTVTGVEDDNIVDGSPAYTVLLGAPTTTDTAYAEIDPADVALINVDNDTAGFVVSAAAGHTKEPGVTTTFSIRLRSRPSGDVTIPISSSDPTEGSLLTDKVVLTPSDWNQPHPVTVHGEDDEEEDGDQPYSIITAQSSSSDPNYDKKQVDDVALLNEDNDTAGYDIVTTSTTTDEDGKSITFTVALKSKPTAPVVMPVSSSNEDEGTVSVKQLTFSLTDWKDPHPVTVTGVDDDNVADGGIGYKIVLDKPTTTDAKYALKDPTDVSLINDDNDSAALRVLMPVLMETSEATGSPSVSFKVVLHSKPKGTVLIPIVSSNELEGAISDPAAPMLTFTPATWSIEQTVTVTGVDDLEVDGPKPYNIKVGPPDTADASYSVLPAQFVNLTNLDDE